MAATCVMAVVLTACNKSSTSPEPARTHSVTTTASVPANPTAPLTLTTNDPQSSVQVTLDAASLQAIAQAVGGAASVKLTDMAPVDYGTLPSTEVAKFGQQPLGILVLDVTPAGAAGSNLAMASRLANSTIHITNFSIVNNTGKRCTPGVVDLYQIFGSTATLLASTIVIDDAQPLQFISGSANDVNYAVLHFIFDFECPRVTPTGGG